MPTKPCNPPLVSTVVGLEARLTAYVTLSGHLHFQQLGMSHQEPATPANMLHLACSRSSTSPSTSHPTVCPHPANSSGRGSAALHHSAARNFSADRHRHCARPDPNIDGPALGKATQPRRQVQCFSHFESTLASALQLCYTVEPIPCLHAYAEAWNCPRVDWA